MKWFRMVGISSSQTNVIDLFLEYYAHKLEVCGLMYFQNRFRLVHGHTNLYNKEVLRWHTIITIYRVRSRFELGLKYSVETGLTHWNGARSGPPDPHTRPALLANLISPLSMIWIELRVSIVERIFRWVIAVFIYLFLLMYIIFSAIKFLENLSKFMWICFYIYVIIK